MLFKNQEVFIAKITKIIPGFPLECVELVTPHAAHLLVFTEDPKKIKNQLRHKFLVDRVHDSVFDPLYISTATPDFHPILLGYRVGSSKYTPKVI